MPCLLLRPADVDYFPTSWIVLVVTMKLLMSHTILNIDTLISLSLLLRVLLCKKSRKMFGNQYSRVEVSEGVLLDNLKSTLGLPRGYFWEPPGGSLEFLSYFWITGHTLGVHLFFFVLWDTLCVLWCS